MALVLDRSGSMTGAPVVAAREAASRAVAAMAPWDYVTVVSFDSRAELAIALGPRGDGHAATSAIATITPGGGTEGYPALELSYRELATAPIARRHVVFVTDGRMPSTGVLDLVDRMRACDITISAVGLGGDNDEHFLRSIAEHGGGHAHLGVAPDALGGVFLAEYAGASAAAAASGKAP